MELLERRIGPFAVWTWAAVIGAGLILAVAWRRMAEGEGGGGLRGGGPRTFTLDPTQGTTFAPDGAVQAGAPGSGTPETNAQWLRRAASKVRDAGFSALLTDTALRRYLEGLPLTSEQAAVIERAIQLAGPPPEGAPPAQVGDAPSGGDLTPQPPGPTAPPPPPPAPKPPPALPPPADNAGQRHAAAVASAIARLESEGATILRADGPAAGTRGAGPALYHVLTTYLTYTRPKIVGSIRTQITTKK